MSVRGADGDDSATAQLHNAEWELERTNVKAVDLSKIPGGATGTAAIYTESVVATHLICKVMMRMEAWMNYIKP